MGPLDNYPILALSPLFMYMPLPSSPYLYPLPIPRFPLLSFPAHLHPSLPSSSSSLLFPTISFPFPPSLPLITDGRYVRTL